MDIGHAVVAGALAALLIAAGLLGPGLDAGAESVEGPAVITREAYFTNPLTQVTPPVLRNGFPPATACLVAGLVGVAQLCGTEVQQLSALLGLSDGLPIPILPDGDLAQPVVLPGTTPVGMIAGQQRYTSLFQLALPTIAEGQELASFELVLHQDGLNFAIESPATRDIVLQVVAQLEDQNPQLILDAVTRALSGDVPLVTQTVTGIEACPTIQTWNGGPAQGANLDGVRLPDANCQLGTTGVYDPAAGTWTFDLTFAAQAWLEGGGDGALLPNEGILLRPVGAPNFAYGDPDVSTNWLVSLSNSSGAGGRRPIIRYSTVPGETTGDLDLGDTGSVDLPSFDSSGGPVDFGLPNTPPDASVADAPPASSNGGLARSKGHTPGWVWLALPLGALGATIFGQSLAASPAATRRRPGALTHLEAARAHAAAESASAPPLAVPEPVAVTTSAPTAVHRPRSRRALALVAALALMAVVAACGQKPGTHVAAGDSETAANASAGGEVTDGGVIGGEVTDGGTATGGTATGGTATGGTATGGTATGGTTGGATGAGATLTITGKDRTGVSADAINLSVHAPVTGAAPLPAESFQKANDTYWRYVTEVLGEKVLGRSKVNVAFKDDKYTPNTAIQACRELASSSFLLVGAGGTDQIQACAQFAEQAKVPYLSVGVTEVGLKSLKSYFAASMTYAQQANLLAQYVKTSFPGKKVAAIITNTPNFDDASTAWDAAVKAQGLNYFKTLRHPKGNNSWITAYSSEMKGAGVEVLFILSAPVDYIQFAQQAGTQNFKPQYVGLGISKGLNAVLGAGCPDVNGGIFFSPFPGLDWARQNLPEFFAASQRFGKPSDDIALALWGLASVEHEAFKRYEQVYKSTDLTREDFVKMLEQQQGIQTKVFPQLSYKTSDHFGAGQVHVLQADCGAGEHKTLATFASGF